MTAAKRSTQGAVHWLTAQALMFGAMAALLGIVANAMFLDAYGSAWLPVTYIAIGAAGIAVSGAIARTAQRFELLGIAVVVLGGAAVGLIASWIVAAGGDGAWVSVPLLVLFPILIQLGFVFIGGQAGRLLDIAGIKASFPRIMTGFPIGAVIGGLLGGQLVTWLGRTEDLLLATALAQAAFAGLVLATGRRYASQLGSAAAGPPRDQLSSNGDRPDRPSLRSLLTSPFVALILAYQLLSALGSQLSDFLVFDRATAQYPDAADLARFLAGYTAVMNTASIAFLFALAGPLLRRFGLRLGIAANPLALTVFAAGMVAVNAVTGGTSLALLMTVSAARIADIALTDGTTRTSINATYQVLPERDRLPVQTAVEGIGVPVAIAISGALILILNVLPMALAATIAVTVVVCAIWTWAGLLVYRAYGPALVNALARRPLLVPSSDLDATPEDEALAVRLLSSPDGRATRLGLDLLTAMSSPVLLAELGSLASDRRPDIRMGALVGLSASGDESARRRLADEVSAAAVSTDPNVRLRAAQALEALDSSTRTAFAGLLEDADPTVRSAALESVDVGDTFAVSPAIAALGDPRSAAAAAGALGRLGDAVVPAMAELLDAAGTPAPLPALRLVRAATTRSAARDAVLERYAAHADRELGLVILERLVGPELASNAAAAVLDRVLDEDVRQAARVLGAIDALARAGDLRETDAPLRRALRDELDLVRLRVRAGRLARHGSARLGPVMVELGAGGSRGALALEALDVQLSPSETKLVHPLLQPDLSVAERLDQLAAHNGDAPLDLEGCLRDLVEDPERQWRSSWLRACGIHAARGRGILDHMNIEPARALGDRIVDEVLSERSPADP